MKLLVFVGSLWLLGITAWGQPVFQIDSLPKQGMLLNKAWKWHLGDNPEWAKSDFNDTGWDTLNPVQELDRPHIFPLQGIGWLRIRLAVPPSLRGQLIGLNVIQAGATEVFLNGQLVCQNGEINAQKRVEQGSLPNYLPPIPFSQDSIQVLAVRYAFSRGQLTKIPFPFFLVRIYSATAVKAKNSFLQSNSQVDTTLIGVFLIMGILQLLLYATSTQQRTNLYFGLFLLAQCFEHLNTLLGRDPQLSPDLFVISNQVLFVEIQQILFLFFASVSSLFYLLGIYRFFNQPKDGYFFIALVINLATLPTFLLVPADYTEVAFLAGEYILPATIPYLAILRIGIQAINQKKQGAILFTVAHSVLLLTFILMGLGDVWPFFRFLAANHTYFFLLSFLSLAVTISLLLSQERLATNKLLRKQLLELDSLSKKTIAQEQEKQQILATQNERLEQQVEVRTAELAQSLVELKTTQAQLIQKEKLASLGELTAGIAHEIQNPLNFVNNFSEVSAELIEELKEEAQAGHTEDVLAIADDLTSNLQKIHHHGGRASSIVKGMLEHSRASTGERQPTNLNALVDEYLRLAYQGQRAKDKRFTCELITDYDPDLGQVDVVPGEIGRVLLNLYTNAFYAVRERSEQAGSDYTPRISVSTSRTKDGVQLQVVDNGTGMPKSVQQKIFQPFFTTKPTGEGTGLGLSLSYDIITKGHGGTLRVESQAGEGSTFFIELPYRQKSNSQA